MLNKKTRDIFVSCMLLILVMIIFSACSLPGISELTGIGGQIGILPDGLYIDNVKAEIIEPERESVAFNNLGKEDKQIYLSAYTALCGMNNEFVLRGVDYDRYLTAYVPALTAFFQDFPEFFWLDGYVEANAEYQEGSSKGNVTFTLKLYDYWMTNDIKSAASELKAEVKRIADAARAYPTDFERVKYVHDTIILSVEYDTESFELGDKITKEADAKNNTGYGALIDGTALCGGYAKAFMLVMQELGINCEYITGVADGGPHAWNMIELDGEYYHIDLTWDDVDGAACEIVYSYFCLNDDEISKNHEPDAEYDSLTSSATKYNYHVYNGLYLEEYSFDAVKKMAETYDGSGLFSIKCANGEVLDKAVNDLISGSKIYDINDFSSVDSYQYMADEDLFVLTFILH